MRHFFKSIYAVGLGAVLSMTACDSERFYPTPDFATGGNGYVAFKGSSAVINESNTFADAEGNSGAVNNTHQITVYRSSESYDAAATVNISMTAEYTSDSDFASAGDDASANVKILGNISSLEIPAGEAEATFTVETTEDIFSAGDIRVVFEITGASGNYTPGASQAAIGTTFSLTIQDDDCPIDLAGVWAGEYSVGDFCGSEGAFNEGACSGALTALTVTLTPDETDPAGVTAIISGLATEDFKLRFNTCPMTVSFEGQYDFAAAPFNIATGAFYPTTFAAPNFFDPTSLTIQFPVEFTDAGGAAYRSFDIILTKN